MSTNPTYLHFEGRTVNLFSSLIFKHSFIDLVHGAPNYKKHLIQKAPSPRDYWIKDSLPVTPFETIKPVSSPH
jgi:hypothetical protein